MSVPDGAGAIGDSLDGAVVSVVVVSVVVVVVVSDVLLVPDPLPLLPQATASVLTANAAAIPAVRRKRRELRSTVMVALDSVS
ncbi:MAG: hypothetical protein QOE74_980 [Mycobacterium sp.]|nr:hypothetical protein [Mycobacterium sp.]